MQYSLLLLMCVMVVMYVQCTCVECVLFLSRPIYFGTIDSTASCSDRGNRFEQRSGVSQPEATKYSGLSTITRRWVGREGESNEPLVVVFRYNLGRGSFCSFPGPPSDLLRLKNGLACVKYPAWVLSSSRWGWVSFSLVGCMVLSV